MPRKKVAKRKPARKNDGKINRPKECTIERTNKRANDTTKE